MTVLLCSREKDEEADIALAEAAEVVGVDLAKQVKAEDAESKKAMSFKKCRQKNVSYLYMPMTKRTSRSMSRMGCRL